MKVLAIMGGPRKHGSTFQAVQTIEEELKKLEPGLEMEYIHLVDYNISPCRGCRACFDRGEMHCPLKDDVPAIAAKMLEADGVILSSPTFVGSMNGILKNLLDRLAYFCHRPAFHDKRAWVVTTVGSGGSFYTLLSMSLPLGSMGFSVINKTGITTHTGKEVPVPDAYMGKIRKQAGKFMRSSQSGKHCRPTVSSLVSFKLNRKYYTGKKEPSYDADYWRGKGWLEQGKRYFYDAPVNPFKRMAAGIIGIFLTKI